MNNSLHVLVTGAAGYVGQHLCLALSKAGHQVRGLSRSPQPPHLQHISWLSGDVTDFQTVSQALQGCHAVIHLACLQYAESIQKPLLASHVNSHGTLVLLEAARHYRDIRIIFTSTGHVYGGHAPLPNNETDPVFPDTAYAVSKYVAEHWCMLYTHVHQMHVQTVRLFNVYGPMLDGTPRPTVEAIFARHYAQGKAPKIFGHIENGRDFIHISDVVRALQLCLQQTTLSGPINIGTGVLTTLYDLAILEAALMGCPHILPELVPSDDPPVRFQAATNRAYEVLGFRAEVSLHSGMAEIARNHMPDSSRMT